jgi:hypothetical protein
MTARYRLSLAAVIRALALAVVVSFGFSAVSLAYAAGHHAAAQGDALGWHPAGSRAAGSEALG